jgi:V/A-type H+/Na+-transporting ATPase subunit C
VFDFLFDPNSPVLWLLIIAIISGAIAAIIRPFSSYIKFVYPNAKFEAIGSPYLSMNTLQKLIESSSLEDFIEQINANKDYTIQGKDAREVQQSLDKHFLSILTQMKKDSSKKMIPFYNRYLEKKDAPVVKQMLHKIHNHEPFSIEEYDSEMVTDQTKQLMRHLKESNGDDYQQILKDFGFTDDEVHTILLEETLPLTIDSIVDKYYLHNLDQVKVPYKCKQPKDLYLSKLKDIITIQLLLRAKHMNYHEKLCKLMFIDEGYEISKWKFFELCKTENVTQLISGLEGTSYYQTLKQAVEKNGKEKDIQALTTALDILLLHFIKQLSQQHYTTIGPTLRFLISKEAEIKNLKIISKGVIEQLSKELITPLFIMEAES